MNLRLFMMEQWYIVADVWLSLFWWHRIHLSWFWQCLLRSVSTVGRRLLHFLVLITSVLIDSLYYYEAETFPCYQVWLFHWTMQTCIAGIQHTHSSLTQARGELCFIVACYTDATNTKHWRTTREYMYEWTEYSCCMLVFSCKCITTDAKLSFKW